MERRLVLLCVLFFATVTFAAFDDVVSETTNKTVQSNAAQSVDVSTLAFEKEISGFAYNSSKATLSSVELKIKTVMKAILPLIQKIPETYKIKIIGYADGSGPEYAEGTKQGNQQLSLKRAKSVMEFIVKNYNLSADRFDVIGKGSKELKDSAHPKSSNNRRVVIKFQP